MGSLLNTLILISYSLQMGIKIRNCTVFSNHLLLLLYDLIRCSRYFNSKGLYLRFIVLLNVLFPLDKLLVLLQKKRKFCWLYTFSIFRIKLFYLSMQLLS
jgi:hypothetical protein